MEFGRLGMLANRETASAIDQKGAGMKIFAPHRGVAISSGMSLRELPNESKVSEPLPEIQAIREFFSDEKREENAIETGSGVSAPGRPRPRRAAAASGEGTERENVVGRPPATPQ
jgi:hypothetical protein